MVSECASRALLVLRPVSQLVVADFLGRSRLRLELRLRLSGVVLARLLCDELVRLDVGVVVASVGLLVGHLVPPSGFDGASRATLYYMTRIVLAIFRSEC